MRVRWGTSTILLLLVVHVTASRAQDPVQELEQKLEAARTAPAQDAAVEEIGELPEPRRPAVPDPPADGAGPPRPSLGISVVDITELTRRRFGITVDHGAVINQVRAGYPAARAGLPLGGVIVSVNGQRIGSAQELVDVIQAFRPGEEIELTYFEGDRIGRKKVRLTPALVPPPPPARAGLARRVDPPLRLGDRQPGERPILDALERALETFVPLPDEAAAVKDLDVPPPPTPTPPPPPPPGKRNAGGASAATNSEPPPPPPPNAAPPDAPPPALEAPAAPAPAADDELQELRRQIQTLQQQLEQMLRRLEELERKR